MKLSDAARYFDDCNVLDSDDGFLFKAQLDIYDKSTSEGISSSRRTLNTTPGAIVIPTNKLFKIDSQTYIAGREVQDSFQGGPIRDSVVLQETNSNSLVYNIIDLLNSGSASLTSRSFLSWRKTQKEEQRTAEYFNLYDIYLPEDISIIPAQIAVCQLDQESTQGYYLVSTLERSVSGFSRVVTYQLEAGAYGSVSYFAYLEYDPTSGISFSASALESMLEVRYLVGYNLERFSSKKFEVGDIIFFSKLTTLKIKDELEKGGKRYRVISVTDDAFGATGLLSAHCRVTDA